MSKPTRQRQKRERKKASDDDQEPKKKDSKRNLTKKSVSSVEESESQPDCNIIMRLPNIVRATVINRPSKVVRSPYMADIIVDGGKAEVLCHSPALGCAGLIIPGTRVLVTPKTGATQSKYSLDLVDLGVSIVGVNPMMCNKVEIEKSNSRHFSI